MDVPDADVQAKGSNAADEKLPVGLLVHSDGRL